MAEETLRTIPYNELAERSVLGAILLDKECISTVMEFVTVDDFYDPRNKEAYEAMLDLFNADKPIDVITLAEQLKIRGTYDKIGGDMFVVDIGTAVSTSANVRHYAKIVADYALRRRLIDAANGISELAYEGNEEIEKIVDLSEHRIFDVSHKRNISGFEQIRDVLSKNFADISLRATSDKKITGLTTGFSKIDEILSGLNKSNLIIIAARPAMGKTSFALNIAQAAAMKANAKVAVFSLEMSAEEIVNRMWFSEAMVENNKIRNGMMTQDDWARLTTAMSLLSTAQIYVDDTAAMSPMQIRSKCRRLMAEKGLDLIIIDHMQLMESTVKRESRQQEITQISRELKMIAKDFEIPVVALSQLSRASDKRSGGEKRPTMSDIRESGSIEQDADAIMMIYRDEYYSKENSEHPGEAEIIIEKNRSGETGRVYLKWQGEFTRFSDIDYIHQEE